MSEYKAADGRYVVHRCPSWSDSEEGICSSVQDTLQRVVILARIRPGGRVGVGSGEGEE